MANTSSAQESLRRCTMHVIIFYILFSLSSFSFVFYNVIYIEKSITLYIVHWHQHARGGSPGGAIHDLYGESTNKTGGRVWIALYVKKQLKVIFNIPRFPLHMKIWLVKKKCFFSQVHSINLVDHYSWFLFCYTFMEQLYMYFDRKVSLPGLLLQ